MIQNRVRRTPSVADRSSGVIPSGAGTECTSKSLSCTIQFKELTLLSGVKPQLLSTAQYSSADKSGRQLCVGYQIVDLELIDGGVLDFDHLDAHHMVPLRLEHCLKDDR